MNKETEDAIVRIATKIMVIMFALYGIVFVMLFKADEVIDKIKGLFRRKKANPKKERGYSEMKMEVEE